MIHVDVGYVSIVSFCTMNTKEVTEQSYKEKKWIFIISIMYVCLWWNAVIINLSSINNFFKFEKKRTFFISGESYYITSFCNLWENFLLWYNHLTCTCNVIYFTKLIFFELSKASHEDNYMYLSKLWNTILLVLMSNFFCTHYQIVLLRVLCMIDIFIYTKLF